MKKIYYIILRSALFAVAALCLASCIKDDLSNCIDPRGNVRLTIKLDAKATTKSLDSYQIDSTHVYVFNANDEFVDFATGGVYDPTQEYELFFTLEESGDYRFVVWTNPGETYKANYSEQQCYAQQYTTRQLQYFMNIPADKQVAQDIPDLLYGTTKQGIISHVNNTVVVEMTPNNYYVNVKVKGLPQTNDDDFEFSITDNNSHYNFENTIIRTNIDDFAYTRRANQQAGELNVSFNVLRLSDKDGHAPEFVFANTTQGENLYSANLIGMIHRAYEQSGQELDFDKIRSFDIVLTLDIDMGVTVSINGWEYSSQPGELG